MNTPYALAAFRGESEKLLKVARPGNRSVPFSKVVFKTFQFVAGGELEDEWAEEHLHVLADTIGLSRKEADGWIKSYRKRAAGLPRTSPGRRA